MFDIFSNKQKLTSDIINEIQYNKNNKEYEGKSFIKIFNQTGVVRFTTNIEYAEKCINSLNNKELYDEACNRLIKLCNDEVKNYLDNDEYAALYNLTKEQILSHVSDLSILIDECREDSIGYCITGNCDWNEEHGFIIVICDNKIKYIGENDNLYSPWENYNV